MRAQNHIVRDNLERCIIVPAVIESDDRRRGIAVLPGLQQCRTPAAAGGADKPIRPASLKQAAQFASSGKLA
jgi:hypothetical protein